VLLDSAAIIFATLLVNANEKVEIAEAIIGSKGDKETIHTVLKVARSKPVLSITAGIICLACPLAVGTSASTLMCVACGILLSKVIG
jgi:hypothetical protein